VEPTLSSAPTFETAGIRWWLDPATDPVRARRAIAAALRELAAGAESVKRGRRKQFYRLDLGEGLGEFLLKQHHYDRSMGPLRRLRAAKSRRELAIASALQRRGIDTPVPIAAGEARDGSWLRSCYLLVPFIPESSDFEQLQARENDPRRERAERFTALGRLVRRLHDAGLRQDDMAPNNFLLRSGSPESPLPIDFERARMRRRIGTRTRSRMLAQLDGRLAGASASDRMRFLLAYSNADRRSARRWWRRLVRASATQAAREYARLLRNAGVEGRRVERVQWGGWSGWASRGAPELALARNGTDGPQAGAVPETLALLVEADGPLWRCSSTGSERAARRLWATAELLWTRRLGPRPVAILRRADDRLRLWLARDPTAQPLLEQRESHAARAAAVVLIDRLLALGHVEPWLSPRKITLLPRFDGSLRAELNDPAAFRCTRSVVRGRRLRARRFVARRLDLVEQLLEIVKKSDA
jgi:hypothetical protein